MDATLVIVGGKANKSQVSVKLPAVIGRSREADLTVAHPMVSRRHCELYEVDGLVMVRDLGSLNGLFFGGEQVEEAALHPNAEFSIGPLTFRVEYEYAGATELTPDENTVNEAPEDPGPGLGADVGMFRADDHAPAVPPPQELAIGDERLSLEEEPASEGAPPSPADAQPAIAPPDGELPDFAAWGAGKGGQAEPAGGEQAGGPSLPPLPPLSGAAPVQEEAAPVQKEAAPVQEEAAPETDHPEAPTPLPPPPLPGAETITFEPDEMAAPHGKTDEPAAQEAEGDEMPDVSGVEPAEPQAPAAQQPPEPSVEGPEEPAADRQPSAEEGKGLFDLSLPPPSEPQEAERDQAESSDDPLDDFLKGFQ